MDSEAKKPQIQEEKKVSGHHGRARHDFERAGRRSHAHVRHRKRPQRDDSHEASWRFVLHENQRKKPEEHQLGPPHIHPCQAMLQALAARPDTAEKCFWFMRVGAAVPGGVEIRFSFVFCCAMMGCCRRPGRGRNTGLLGFCCAMLVCCRRPRAGIKIRRPSSTSPISASTSWEVSRRTAQAMTMSQAGSCSLTVPPLFALASAVSSLVAQSWEMTQTGRTSARVAQAWTTSQAGCMATSMGFSSRVLAGSVGMCEVSNLLLEAGVFGCAT